MACSPLPALLARVFLGLSTALDPRSALRLPALLCGLLLGGGRGPCTAWFRAAGIGDDYRRAYHVVGAVRRCTESVATRLLATVDPLLLGARLLAAVDDTPTPRLRPCVEGAGIHPNPSPGPAWEACG